MIAVLSTLNVLLEPPPVPDAFLLTIYCALAVIIAAVAARDIWMLKVRRFPLWFDILIYAGILGGLAVLIYIREAGILVWNKLYVDVPLVLFLVLMGAAAAITEAKKGVRVYLGARTFVFVDNKAGA